MLFGEGDLKVKKLIVSPDGRYFPFEALIINNNFKKPEYIIKKYAISYCYSASFLTHKYQIKYNDASNSFLGMAPVNYPSNKNLATLVGSDVSLKISIIISPV